MTLHSRLKKKRGVPRAAYRPLFSALMVLFFLLLFLRNTEIAISFITQGLRLCTGSVIPSLFPFMVLSELLVGGGLAEELTSRLPPWLHQAFGFSRAGFGAFLLGLFCGFPVGARCAMIALDAARIDRTEAERILCFATIPSSAFMISAVGVSLWGSRRLGTSLYLTLLGITILGALLDASVRKIKEKKRPSSPTVSSSVSIHPCGISLFTQSVRNAARSMMLVCAYVLFFSALGGVLGYSVNRLSPPPLLGGLLFSVLELSGGVSHAAGIPSRASALALTAFSAGWCGLSVHFQVLSVCEGRGLSFRKYFLTKLLHGMLATLLFLLLWRLFPMLTEEGCQAFG